MIDHQDPDHPDRYLAGGDRVVRLDDSEGRRTDLRPLEHHQHLAFSRTANSRRKRTVLVYDDDGGGIHDSVPGEVVQVCDIILGREARIQFRGLVRHRAPSGGRKCGVRRDRGER